MRAEGFFEGTGKGAAQRRDFDFFRAFAFARLLPLDRAFLGRTFAFGFRFGFERFFGFAADFGFAFETGFAGIDCAAAAGGFGRALPNAFVRKASERCHAMRAEFGS